MARILVIGKYYPPFRGGIEAYTQAVSERLAREHHVDALVFNHERGATKFELINGVHVRRYSTPAKVASQPLSIAAAFGLRTSSYDLVHFHAPNPLLSLPLLAQLTLRGGPRVVITHHMDIYQRGHLRTAALALYRALQARTDALIVTSMKTAMVSTDIVAPQRATVIPLGIDPDPFTRPIDDECKFQEWRTAKFGQGRLACFIGRHVRYKGLEVLMEAAARIPDLSVAVAGEGPRTCYAKELAQSLNITDRVFFLGLLSEPEKIWLLHASDVFVFPSTEITEAFGISQLEAMAAGVPVVSSNLPTGVTDVAVHEETALLAAPSDPEDLAKQIRRILDTPHLAETLTKNALHRVRTQFNGNIVTEQTYDLFSEILAGGSAPRYAS